MTPTWEALQRATKQVDSKPGRASLLLTVDCLPLGCGPRPATGDRLAQVWRTDEGLLYLAELTVDHMHLPRFPDVHPDAVVLRNRVSGELIWQTRRGLPWFEAEWDVVTGIEPEEGWRPQRSTRVRDLLNRQDLDHVPLRASCRRHGEVVLSPKKVLAEVDEARRSRARHVRINAVLSGTLMTGGGE